MREFGSLAAFAGFTTLLIAEVEHAKHGALEHAAVIVETEAKRVIGTHDYNWPPLEQATIDRKKHGDTPLLETGEMRDSIEHTVHQSEIEHVAYIGSNNDKAVWQELGTSKIPPRSFLAGAAHHKIDEVLEVIGLHVVQRMIKP